MGWSFRKAFASKTASLGHSDTAIFILLAAVLNSVLGMIQLYVDFIIPIKYFM